MRVPSTPAVTVNKLWHRESSVTMNQRGLLGFMASGFSATGLCCSLLLDRRGTAGSRRDVGIDHPQRQDVASADTAAPQAGHFIVLSSFPSATALSALAAWPALKAAPGFVFGTTAAPRRGAICALAALSASATMIDRQDLLPRSATPAVSALRPASAR